MNETKGPSPRFVLEGKSQKTKRKDRPSVSFQALKDPEIFINRCCVMNDTLAWDVEGSGDAARCIDIDPDPLYEMAEFPGEELQFRVSLHWDEEAGVWTAESQDVPGLILEDEDHGRLMERMRSAATEIQKINRTPKELRGLTPYLVIVNPV